MSPLYPLKKEEVEQIDDQVNFYFQMITTQLVFFSDELN